MSGQEAIIEVDLEGVTKNQTKPIDLNELNQGDKGHNEEEQDKNMERKAFFNKVKELKDRLTSRVYALQIKTGTPR